VRATRGNWAAFLGWFVVGALYALAVLAILTIGIFVLPIAIGLTVVLVRSPRASAGLPGLVSGLALPVLYVAYLNRDGPGDVCTTHAGGVNCTEEWSPWPFLVVGVALVCAGLALFVYLRARADRAPRPA
jgi:hypothetical protein